MASWFCFFFRSRSNLDHISWQSCQSGSLSRDRHMLQHQRNRKESVSYLGGVVFVDLNHSLFRAASAVIRLLGSSVSIESNRFRDRVGSVLQ